MFLSAVTYHLLLFPAEHALKASHVQELKVTRKLELVQRRLRPHSRPPLPSSFPFRYPVLQKAFVDECKFRETLLPNNYNAYESFVYKGFYIALSKHGRVRKGNRATTAMTVTHFLPRL